MRPTLEISNDPRYQEKTRYEHIRISEMITDDNSEGCVIQGEYLFASGEQKCIIYLLSDFIVIPKTRGYFPVISEESKKELVEDILKTRHGRNVNFV